MPSKKNNLNPINERSATKFETYGDDGGDGSDGGGGGGARGRVWRHKQNKQMKNQFSEQQKKSKKSRKIFVFSIPEVGENTYKSSVTKIIVLLDREKNRKKTAVFSSFSSFFVFISRKKQLSKPRHKFCDDRRRRRMTGKEGEKCVKWYLIKTYPY